MVNDYVTTPGTPIPYDIPVGTVPIIAPNYINGKFLTTSGDWNISDKDQLHMRYIYNRYSQIDIGAELPVFFTPLLVPFHLVTVGEYHTFTPNIINEVRVGYTRTSNSYTVPNFQFPGLDAFPNLTIDDLNGINVGPAPSNPQYATGNTYQLQDNVSWNFKNHSFKFGLDLRKQIDPQLFVQRSRGDYDWASLDGFVNHFMPGFGQRSFGSVGYSGDDKMYGWYVNDIWKITRNLSLNLGVRYEYLTVPKGWEQQTLNAVADDPNVIPGQRCTFSDKPHASKTNFMPRIGFAYGRAAAAPPRFVAAFLWRTMYSLITSARSPVRRKSGPPSTARTPGGFPSRHRVPGQRRHPAAEPEWNFGSHQEEAQAATSSYLLPNVQYPYSESWNLGIQHVFGPYTAEVRYVGSRGIHLDTQNILNFATYVTKTELSAYVPASPIADRTGRPLRHSGWSRRPARSELLLRHYLLQHDLQRWLPITDYRICAVGLVNLPWLTDPSATTPDQRSPVAGGLDLESRNRQQHGGLFLHSHFAPPSAGFSQPERREGQRTDRPRSSRHDSSELRTSVVQARFELGEEESAWQLPVHPGLYVGDGAVGYGAKRVGF